MGKTIGMNIMGNDLQKIFLKLGIKKWKRPQSIVITLVSGLEKLRLTISEIVNCPAWSKRSCNDDWSMSSESFSSRMIVPVSEASPSSSG